MYKQENDVRVVIGATKVPGIPTQHIPDPNDMFFLVLQPLEGEDNVTRHGMTYKEFRVPHRYYKKAIQLEFPFVANVRFIHHENEKRPKIESFTTIDEDK